MAKTSCRIADGMPHHPAGGLGAQVAPRSQGSDPNRGYGSRGASSTRLAPAAAPGLVGTRVWTGHAREDRSGFWAGPGSAGYRQGGLTTAAGRITILLHAFGSPWRGVGLSCD